MAQSSKTSESRQQLVLRSVELQRFKAAFKPAAIPLEPFTVIIGRNGSGKSTLLEALQWLDTTLRQDAREASARYGGVHDLINVRSRESHRFFWMGLQWTIESEDVSSDEAETLDYQLRVDESRDLSTPVIGSELMWVGTHRKSRELIQTRTEGDGKNSVPGERILYPSDSLRKRIVDDPDRLALGAIGRGHAHSREKDPLALLLDFWNRAVFLRLSPNRLAQGSPAYRKSFEPILDEEGRNLPALLTELSDTQREELIEKLQGVLSDITAVEVSQPANKRDEAIHYVLKEKMPYVGRKGEGVFPLPAWMLSEGTRRLTAICALLVRDPPPSLLCIEEIENGLDPWTITYVLKLLRSAAQRGTQILVTTHSPWLLDHVRLNEILHVKRTKGETRYVKFSTRKDIEAFSASIPPGAAYVNIEDP